MENSKNLGLTITENIEELQFDLKKLMTKTDLDENGNFIFSLVNGVDGGIASTTYFNTEYANKNLMFVSWNDSNARILMPKEIQDKINNEAPNAFSASVDCADSCINFWLEDGNPQEYLLTIDQRLTDRGLFRQLKERKEAFLFLYGETLGLFKKIPLRIDF